MGAWRAREGQGLLEQGSDSGKENWGGGAQSRERGRTGGEDVQEAKAWVPGRLRGQRTKLGAVGGNPKECSLSARVRAHVCTLQRQRPRI